MKIGFVSLGCPKNLVDSEVMLGMAEKEGHEITADASQADVLVVNPTHLAVALRYDEEEHEAPEVLAKGMDHLAERMIAAQMPAESKRGRADIVIPNAGGLAELRHRAREAWRTLLARAAEADPSMVAAPRRLRMDMHCHTNASFDCLSSPDRVLGGQAVCYDTSCAGPDPAKPRSARCAPRHRFACFAACTS